MIIDESGLFERTLIKGAGRKIDEKSSPVENGQTFTKKYYKILHIVPLNVTIKHYEGV